MLNCYYIPFHKDNLRIKRKKGKHITPDRKFEELSVHLE